MVNGFYNYIQIKDLYTHNYCKTDKCSNQDDPENLCE